MDENGKVIDIRKEIIKLYDHTNLDIARINYTNAMQNKTMSELAKNKLLVEKLRQKVYEAEEALKKADQAQKEYITILGIFAAIVLAFTGGIVFSSSVLENIDKSSIYRISLIAFIIGFVFFNLDIDWFYTWYKWQGN